MTLRTRVLALTALLWVSLSAVWCSIYVRHHLPLGQPGTYEVDADFQVIAFLYVHGASLAVGFIAVLVIEAIALFGWNRRVIPGALGAIAIAAGIVAYQEVLSVLARYPELCARPARAPLECRLFPHLQWIALGLIGLGCCAFAASAIAGLWRSSERR
jgi:hypothetical protein